MGTSRQIIGVVFAGIVLLSAYFTYRQYTTFLEISQDEVLDKLEAVANTTALLIDGDAHEQLSRRVATKDGVLYNAQDSLYLQLHQRLVQSCHANGLTTPLYTLVYNARVRQFEFIGTSAIRPYFRHPYKQFPPCLLEHFDRGARIDVYTTETGTWLSAFAPIRNTAGRTVAVVQADQDFSIVMAKANRELWHNILLSCYAILLILLVLYKTLHTILKREEEYKRMLVQQNEEIRSQNEEIEAQNNVMMNAQLTIEQQNESLRQLNETLDQQVQQQLQQLDQANLDLATFLYRSSHDIHGPLATLKGLCNLARLEINDPGAHEYFSKILRTTLQLERFIKHVNAVYEIKSKPLQPRELILKSLLEDIIQKHHTFVRPDEAIHFVLEISERIQLHMDSDLLDLIFSELIRNAILYRHNRNGIEHLIRLSAVEKSGKKLEIMISDNGSGIDPQAEEKIFNMFQRASEHSRGAGLGLYIVKIGLEKLKGQIELVRQPTRGTTFRITLPYPS